MYDWVSVFANLLWVVGLAIALAAFSLASYRARTEETRLRGLLGAPAFQQGFAAALTLFCVGLLATSHALWEQAAWGVLAVVFWIRTLVAGRRRRRAIKTDTRAESTER